MTVPCRVTAQAALPVSRRKEGEGEPTGFGRGTIRWNAMEAPSPCGRHQNRKPSRRTVQTCAALYGETVNITLQHT